MTTSSGQVTNALHGFTMMLATLLRDHQPDGLAVAFDRPEKLSGMNVFPPIKRIEKSNQTSSMNN